MSNTTATKKLEKKYKEEFPFCTPFVCACETGRLEDVKTFISSHDVEATGMTLKEYVNQEGYYRCGDEGTPLRAAARNKHFHIVEYLVDTLYEMKDLNLLVKEYYKEFRRGTPFVCACEKGRLEDVKTFISSHDVKATGMTLKEYVNQEGYYSDGYVGTPLMAAADGEHFQLVKYLIEQGEADPNIAHSEGYNALHYAAWFNKKDTKVIEFLLTNMSLNSINKNWGGETPLDFAYRLNYSPIRQEIIACICSNGGKANHYDENGRYVGKGNGDLNTNNNDKTPINQEINTQDTLNNEEEQRKRRATEEERKQEELIAQEKREQVARENPNNSSDVSSVSTEQRMETNFTSTLEQHRQSLERIEEKFNDTNMFNKNYLHELVKELEDIKLLIEGDKESLDSLSDDEKQIAITEVSLLVKKLKAKNKKFKKKLERDSNNQSSMPDHNLVQQMSSLLDHANKALDAKNAEIASLKEQLEEEKNAEYEKKYLELEREFNDLSQNHHATLEDLEKLNIKLQQLRQSHASTNRINDLFQEKYESLIKKYETNKSYLNEKIANLNANQKITQARLKSTLNKDREKSKKILQRRLLEKKKKKSPYVFQANE